MATVADILNFMETIAPPHMAEGWDNCGLLCGRKEREVKKILVALGKEEAFVPHFEEPVSEETLASLKTIPEFNRAYGELTEDEFIRYGATQRTLSQFVEVGWSMIADFPL